MVDILARRAIGLNARNDTRGMSFLTGFGQNMGGAQATPSH
jgi:hypothetical protein